MVPRLPQSPHSLFQAVEINNLVYEILSYCVTAPSSLLWLLDGHNGLYSANAIYVHIISLLDTLLRE
jgi:hypothetical protein